jgi:predicted TIM-barrel fold metal-dependent hydrolase
VAKPIRLVDDHQHAFWLDRDDAGLVQDLDEQDIDYAWLLTWEIPPDQHDPNQTAILNPNNIRADGTHAGLTLQDVITAHHHFPARFIPGYCPYPALPNACDLLRAAAKIHGVRICGEWKFRMLVNDPRTLELFRVAGELHMPVLLHFDVPYLPGPDGRPVYQKQWYGGTVENLEATLRACPGTNFIGHAPGFWREISANADQDPTAYPKGPITGPGRLYRLFETYPNLFADLSANSGRTAIARDPVHGRNFILRFADRLLFGRDGHGGDLWQFLQTLDLPQDVLDKTCFRNAERLVPPQS